MRLIDADKAIKILGIKQEEWDTPDERWRPEREFGSVIMNMPTIEAEPVRHGKWIDSFVDTPFISVQMVCVCSSCKDIILRDNKERYLYCPHCGCKMDLEKK